MFPIADAVSYGTPDAYLRTMADGTIKQISPFTGTQVWTVPGRGDRPLGIPAVDPRPLQHDAHTRSCAFCSDNYLKTPPEKARVVRAGENWSTLVDVPIARLFEQVAEFRRIPNLYEIVSLDYWRRNYGYRLPQGIADRMTRYLSEPAGRAHVLGLLRSKIPEARRADVDDEDLLEQQGASFFGGTHDVIVARRHFTDDAIDDSNLASSGTLTVEEHHQYTRFAIASLRELYAANRYARYVAVFQNWLKPAGASFDHLHKQLVAIDERGVQSELELARARVNPNLYNEAAVNFASYQNLVVAENDYAIAHSGFGHRYPTLEIFSKSPHSEPWNHTDEEVRGMSDLIHAVHAAVGADVPSNEEWHHKPPDVDVPMPWRVMIKLRVSTLAGFEGGTKIYLNTISPVDLRDRVVPALFTLRERGRIAATVKIAEECECLPNCLAYNPAVRRAAGDRLNPTVP
ncbi:DUF4921 family protein [Cumulibacter manganitolerans]|uniref:DUF4921 family protein n=1 Tax=Cumulibacter manganitolerans TaxID=1884992 RepID=UPI001E3431A4|nr:DUF4921 family protein [Cumulibacter manganitolerans]